MKVSPIAFLRAGLAFALVLSGSSAGTRAQDNSPEGQWDCVISGSRSGLAYLVFSANTNGGTFEGKTLGTPISMWVKNEDARPEAYTEMATKLRFPTSIVAGWMMPEMYWAEKLAS